MPVAITYYSCKKSDSAGNATDGKMIGAAEQWYISYLSQPAPALTLSKMKLIGEHLDWKAARQFNQEGINYVIAPVTGDKKPFANKDFEAVQHLVFFKDKTGAMQLNVIETVSFSKTSLGNSPMEIANQLFLKNQVASKNKTPAVKAYSIVYDDKYHFKNSYAINNGVVSKAGFRIQKKTLSYQPSAARAAADNLATGTWETWYLVSVLYNIDTGEIISVNVINTWTACSGTCDTWTPVDDMGGTGGPSPQPCLDDLYNNLSTLMGGAHVVAIPVSETVTPFNLIKKYKDIEWTIMTSLEWHLNSYEKGLVKLINTSQNIWQWEYLNHDKIKFIGTSHGGTVAPDNGDGTPSFVPGTPNVLIAGMFVKFNVTFTPNATAACPALNILFPATTKAFSNGGFWDAKP